MNRTELIQAVAERAGSDQAAARRHVDAVFETIMENVASGERVLVTGFGTFDRFARPARQARNPRTGLPIEVAAGDFPRFRVGQTFKDRVSKPNGTAAATTATVKATATAPEVKVAAPAKKAKPKKKAKKPEAKPAAKKSDNNKKAKKAKKTGKSG